MVGIGTVISGKYRLLRLLGDGGMGSVYEAQHEVLGTRVAIKVLHPDLARRTGLVDRFLQEAKVAAQIKSPHVVHVADVDRTADGTAYIVMELLEGEPLSTVLERDRRVPVQVAVDYTRQILTALEAAHSLGVVHRDLKPENVFVTFASGKPVLKLIDFGIAKLRSTGPTAKNLTVAGVVMGTAEYMAPEQAYGADRADARSDIYAVGVMLYEMIAGERPVSGDDARIIATRVERGEVKPLVHAVPDVPREIAGLVHRAMAARPELRFATATEMRLTLEGAKVAPEGGRVATKPIPQAPGAPASVVQPLPAAASVAPRVPASPDAMGPGTVMGAPVEAVFASPPQLPFDPRLMGTGPAAPREGRGTDIGPTASAFPREAPSSHSSHWAPPPQQASANVPSDVPPAPRPRRSRGGLWLLLVIPVLLGVGAVIAYVAGLGREEAGGVPTASTTHAPTTVTASTSVATTAPTPPPTDTQIAPLTGTGAVTPPHPTPHPSGGATSAPTESVPTFPFPSAFPSAFPIPLPSMSGLPSGFPTAFPTAFPPFPPPATPSATSAPSGP